jgi:hypothetical protein
MALAVPVVCSFLFFGFSAHMLHALVSFVFQSHLILPATHFRAPFHPIWHGGRPSVGSGMSTRRDLLGLMLLNRGIFPFISFVCLSHDRFCVFVALCRIHAVGRQRLNRLHAQLYLSVGSIRHCSGLFGSRLSLLYVLLQCN